jgi:cytidylate kinase
MDRPVVAIDGPSGSGKSTVARGVATRLGWRYLDTGAMYRAATLAALEAGVTGDPVAVATIVAAADIEVRTDPEAPGILLGGRDVGADIRSPQVEAAVSDVSALPAVRALLVERQRALINGGRVVVEGRDIGSAVAPDARLKVFLTAPEAVRAGRRAAERAGQVGEVREQLAARDRKDAGRSASPLRRAPDAVEIDTGALSPAEVVDRICDLVALAGLDTVAPGAGASPPPTSPRRAGPAIATRNMRFLVLARTTLQALTRLMFSLRVSGREHVPRSGAALLVGNHRGFLDGPLVAIHTPRPAFFMAKSELFTGALAHVLGLAGQIPVDRGRADRAALGEALNVLANGELLGMFPEGTRGNGRMESVQHGVGYVALRAGVPVVPVACVGTERAMPRGAKLPRFGARVLIAFGPAFRLEATGDPHSRRAVAEAAEEIRAHVAAHLASVERR